MRKRLTIEYQDGRSQRRMQVFTVGILLRNKKKRKARQEREELNSSQSFAWRCHFHKHDCESREKRFWSQEREFRVEHVEMPRLREWEREVREDTLNREWSYGASLSLQKEVMVTKMRKVGGGEKRPREDRSRLNSPTESKTPRTADSEPTTRQASHTCFEKIWKAEECPPNRWGMGCHCRLDWTKILALDLSASSLGQHPWPFWFCFSIQKLGKVLLSSEVNWKIESS